MINIRVKCFLVFIFFINLFFLFTIKSIFAQNPYANLNLYFGDPHFHTNYSDGSRSLTEAYNFARDTANLDFAFDTDHAWQQENMGFLDENEWADIKRIADEQNSPGNFVTMYAYEWNITRSTPAYGHKNVYYLDQGDVFPPRTFIDGQVVDKYITPTSLFETVDDYNSIVIPHHVSALGNNGTTPFFTDWSYRNDQVQSLVEIYSKWGSGECEQCLLNRTSEFHPVLISNYEPGTFVQDALAKGFRLGFVGGSDSHNPGCGPGSQDCSEVAFPNSGLTGVWADSLTRGSLFQALKQKRTYATTGNRTKIKFSADNHFMGEEYLTATSPTFTVNVEAYDNSYQPQPEIITAVEIVKGATGKSSPFPVVYSHLGCQGKTSCSFTWTDNSFSKDALYYLRVILREKEWKFDTVMNLPHLAWSSPIWVNYTTTSTCSQKPLGDADCDDQITLADFIIFTRSYLNEVIPNQNSDIADFNQDTKVNALDFGVWRKNYLP